MKAHQERTYLKTDISSTIYRVTFNVKKTGANHSSKRPNISRRAPRKSKPGLWATGRLCNLKGLKLVVQAVSVRNWTCNCLVVSTNRFQDRQALQTIDQGYYCCRQCRIVVYFVV